MERRLALFDIDGTLLTATGAGKRALGRALLKGFGTTGPIDSWAFGGKTDPQICTELLSAAGISPEDIQKGLSKVLECYVDHLAGELREVVVHPGVLGLIEALKETPQVTLGLLTGNIRSGAILKLDATGLIGYFPFGAFGCDSARRSDLVDIAIERAFGHMGYRFSQKEIAIIGDTPHDIACGRHRGVKAIAVATGPFSCEQLQAHAPDYLFGDFSATKQVVEAILT